MAMKSKRLYTAPNGKTYPLFEAPYPMPVTVYKTDQRKAQIGDPVGCLIARGLKRMKGVEDVWVGCGQDAYVCFKETKLRPAHALHFTINTQAARVRDFFDTHKGVETQSLQLDPPSAGRTHAARAAMNKRRREEIKNGATVAKRERPYTQRITRLGVHRRPKAIVKKNTVVAPPPQAAPPPEQSKAQEG